MRNIGLGCLVFLSSCIAPRTCPVGEDYVDGRCVGPDADVPDAGLPDGEVPEGDTGMLCGDACEGATPFCVGGACVACRDAADCGSALAPICDGGTCVSCDGRSDCTPDQIADEFAAVICETFAHAPLPAYPGVTTEDRTQNASVTAAYCVGRAPLFTRAVDAVRAGRVTVDLAAFRACVAPARERGPAISGLFKVAECHAASVGTVVNGGACIDSSECVSGYCDTTACPGSCEPRVAIGAPCVADAQCPDNAYCSTTCRAVTVDAPRARGEACTASYQCDAAAGLVCLGPTGSQTCQDAPTAGQPCVDDSADLTCAVGHYCDGATCRARIALGMPCTDAVSCVAGARCSGSPMTCVAVALPGEACDGGQQCADGNECLGGVCAALPDVGEACRAACLRGTCTGGTCTSLAVGTPCAEGGRAGDALDPCGDGVSCEDAGASWQCLATAATGETCGAGIDCNAPNDECYQADTCRPICTL